MIDEATCELLSRAADDDLDEAGRAQLEARLEADPGLARELVAIRSVQEAVKGLAATMAPPATLDQLLLPLRRGAAPASRAERGLRWLGYAAALSVTVLAGSYLGFRETSRPSLDALARVAERPASGDSGPYQLRPLPTSSVPASEQPIGVAERLLAQPPVMPGAEPPGALEVLGPLPLPTRPESAGRWCLVLWVTGDELTMPAPMLDGCGASVPWEVTVVVGAGRLESVLPEEGANDALARCSRLLIGCEAPGLPDGSYSGEVRVTP